MALSVNSITHTIKNFAGLRKPVYQSQWWMVTGFDAAADIRGCRVACYYMRSESTAVNGVVTDVRLSRRGNMEYHVTPDAGQGIYTSGKWLSYPEIVGIWIWE